MLVGEGNELEKEEVSMICDVEKKEDFPLYREMEVLVNQ